MNKIAHDFFNKAINRMGYLAGRWNDERQYEDINDYRANLQTFAATNGFPTVTVTKMIKRPFGCEFTVENETYRYTVTMGGKASCWKVS